MALVNDTTGTELAVGIEDHNCHVGLIFGFLELEAMLATWRILMSFPSLMEINHTRGGGGGIVVMIGRNLSLTLHNNMMRS